MAKTSKRFYVYRFDKDGACLYIGKGTGQRLKVQERRFGFAGVIVKEFSSEKLAYNHEASLIKKFKPLENKVAGGGGAIARRKQFYRKSADEIEMGRIGTRLFAARFLLKKDLSRFLAADEIQNLRKVAFDLESNNQTGYQNA